MVYVGRLPRLGEIAIPSFLAFLATGPIGVLFYNILPALGPAHRSGTHFPWSPLSVSQASRIFLERVTLAGAPNAIPSLHMAWVLLVQVRLRLIKKKGWLKATPLCFEIVLSLLQRQTGHRSSCCGVIANHA